MNNLSINIHNQNCVDSNAFSDESVDLFICDPPFGIAESSFDQHYNRDQSNVIEGYVEAPENYPEFTLSWMTNMKRMMKPNASAYIVIGHSNLIDVINAARELNLHEINHIIWKYSFGVYTKNKYVTSHYHILYYSKSKKSKTTFNRDCRFSDEERLTDGSSAQYKDREDVWFIKKEYSPGEKKNVNKLPNELVRKMILYSSNQGDVVCDFFMGNFTTAYVAKSLSRSVYGFELNKNSYDYHMGKLNEIEWGSSVDKLNSKSLRCESKDIDLFGD